MTNETIEIYPSDDLVFKRIFGDKRNTNVLKSLLKSILNFDDDELSKLEIIESSSKIDKSENEEEVDKITILDVKCTTKSGKIIGIELQVARDTTMRSRVLYSNAKTLVQQLKKGSKYSDLKEVITIVISTEHVIIKECNDYKYCFNFYDAEHKIKLNNLVRIYFLEFQRIPEEINEDEDLINWLKFIGSKSEEEIKKMSTKSPELKEAVSLYEELIGNDGFREEVWKREEAKIRVKSMVYDAKIEGKIEGKIEEKIEIAREMLEDGLPVEKIAKFTKLSIEEIKNLSKEL
ncbi:MAG: Rpn family recombination-promoting nuclease/putative transposase [Clostridiales bacterium]|jgi:predicted transposase/invertase (TIGR01784 family)|nr:Rpn family recombination-promoting nuclease/putative transposase [Clostridiales bacterium]